jgi:hypothetical protein
VWKCFIPRFVPVLLAFLMPAEGEEAPPRTLSVVFETFSLPLARAAALLREKHPDSKLHALCVEGLADQSVRQEGLTVIRTVEKSVASTAAVVEIRMPMDYTAMGGGLIGSGEPPPGDFPSSLVPVFGERYETRFFGFELSLEAKSEPDDDLALQIQPGWTRPAGRSFHGQGTALVAMPEIETQRMKAIIRAKAGKPSLLGTFNRTPESKIVPLAATRVWFAFVTVNPIES